MLTRLLPACAAWLLAACSPLDVHRSNTAHMRPALQPVAADRGSSASDASEIFALEPCDPTRLAVLFVHGANGLPNDWLSFAERLDRSRYQALFFAYPSHESVDEAARGFDEDREGILESAQVFERYAAVLGATHGFVRR